MSSNTYAFLLGLALLGYTGLVALMDRRIATSIVLHNAAWTVALIVLGTGLLNYRPLSPTAWIVITGAIVAFNMGAAFGATPGRRTGAPPLQGSHRLVPLWTYWTLLALFSLGFAIYLLTIARLYGVGTLLTDPISIRGDSDNHYLMAFPLYGKLLFYLGPVCFVLTLFPRLVDKLHQSPFLLRGLVLAYIAVAQVSVLQRTHLFTSALWAVGVYLVASARDPRAPRVAIRARHIVLPAILCIVSFQVIAVALEKTGTSDPGFRYGVSAPMRDSPLTMPLHYATSGVPAFGVLVESRNDTWPPTEALGPMWGDHNPQTWGVATFSVVAKAIPGIPELRSISPFVRVPANTNVFTWLEPWYRDFRAPGALVGSLLVGTVVGWTVRTRSGSTVGLLLCGFLVGMTAQATFANRFTSTIGLLSLFAVAALAVVIRVNGRSDGAEPRTRSEVSAGQGAGEPR